MDALFLELLNRSLAASWLVLIVLVLRPLLKKAPKNLRCLLWGLAALRLLLPARLKSPLSLIPAAAPISVAPGAAPTVESGFAAVDGLVNPALAESFAPVPAAGADPAQIWLHIGALVWLAGLAALLCYALVSVLLRPPALDPVRRAGGPGAQGAAHPGRLRGQERPHLPQRAGGGPAPRIRRGDRRLADGSERIIQRNTN